MGQWLSTFTDLAGDPSSDPHNPVVGGLIQPLYL